MLMTDFLSMTTVLFLMSTNVVRAQTVNYQSMWSFVRKWREVSGVDADAATYIADFGALWTQERPAD